MVEVVGKGKQELHEVARGGVEPFACQLQYANGMDALRLRFFQGNELQIPEGIQTRRIKRQPHNGCTGNDAAQNNLVIAIAVQIHRFRVKVVGFQKFAYLGADDNAFAIGVHRHVGPAR